MKTYFAAPERADEKELGAEIDIANNNPVMTGLLHSISGLLAVIDEHRQIVALNDAFLETLSINNASEALGLRLGEVVQCIHAHDEPAGCGTTKYCSTCGAAIAILSSLTQDEPAERICSLSAKKAGKTINIALLVRSQPIRIDQRRFLLIFLQDITIQEQRAALERTFFHDINNMLNGLLGASMELVGDDSTSELARIIRNASLRMAGEVEIQKCLLKNDPLTYLPARRDISPMQVMEELQSFYAHHPAALNRKIDFVIPGPNQSFKSDLSLMLRILCNMLTNALEATENNGTVKVWIEQDQNCVTFCVWNNGMISEEVALRVFQRNFSTKKGDGRGIGTYAMKLFGESILGGTVGFATSKENGTTFRFSLPNA